MMKKATINSLLIAVYSLLITHYSTAQTGLKVDEAGVNRLPNASAVLDAEATTKGILIPQLALTATNVAAPVTSPANSLLIFNTATAGTGTTAVTPGFYYWDTTSSIWIPLIDNSKGTLVDSSEWIDGSLVGLTTGNVYARKSLANNDTIVIKNVGFPGGSFGIGVPNPSAQLHVNGVGIFETTSGAHFSIRNKANTSNATFQANNRTLELQGNGRYWINRIASDNLEMMTGGGSLTVGGTPPYPARFSAHGLTADATANALMVLDSNLAPGFKKALFTVRNDGNVAVGSKTPQARFHVTIDENGVFDSAVVVTDQSRVGVGTLTPTERLDVIGNIRASGNFISGATTLTVPDYVFETYFDGKSSLKEDYQFKSLKDIEKFVKENKHLPGIPSAKEIKANDQFNVTQSSLNNLEKIEELYLHIIQINREKENLELKVKILEEQNKSFKKELEEIKQLIKDKN